MFRINNTQTLCTDLTKLLRSHHGAVHVSFSLPWVSCGLSCGVADRLEGQRNVPWSDTRPGPAHSYVDVASLGASHLPPPAVVTCSLAIKVQEFSTNWCLKLLFVQDSWYKFVQVWYSRHFKAFLITMGILLTRWTTQSFLSKCLVSYNQPERAKSLTTVYRELLHIHIQPLWW